MPIGVYVRNKLSEQQKDEMVEKYLKGSSTYDLGKEYGVRPCTVGGILKKRGVEIRHPKKLSEREKEDIAKEYQNGSTAEEVGLAYGVKYWAILKVLRTQGIEVRRPGKETILSGEQIDEIVKKYENGASTRKIAKEYGVSNTPIKKALKNRGVVLRIYHKDFSESQKTDMVKKYEDGSDMIEIGKDYGVTRTVVGRILKEGGIKIRRHKIPVEQIKRMTEEYYGGKELNELAKENDMATGDLWKLLKTNGVAMRAKRKVVLSVEQRRDIAGKYVAGTSTTGLGKEYGVTPTRICNILRAEGVEIRNSSWKQLTESEFDDIIKKYEDGASTIELGKEYNVSNVTIGKALKARGVELRGNRHNDRLELARQLL